MQCKIDLRRRGEILIECLEEEGDIPCRIYTVVSVVYPLYDVLIHPLLRLEGEGEGSWILEPGVLGICCRPGTHTHTEHTMSCTVAIPIAFLQFYWYKFLLISLFVVDNFYLCIYLSNYPK